MQKTENKIHLLSFFLNFFLKTCSTFFCFFNKNYNESFCESNISIVLTTISWTVLKLDLEELKKESRGVFKRKNIPLSLCFLFKWLPWKNSCSRSFFMGRSKNVWQIEGQVVFTFFLRTLSMYSRGLKHAARGPHAARAHQEKFIFF